MKYGRLSPSRRPRARLSIAQTCSCAAALAMLCGVAHAQDVDGADAVDASTGEVIEAEPDVDVAEPRADVPVTDDWPPRDELPPLIDAGIDQFRTPVDRLTEHYLGSASRPVRFDWRNSPIILGVTGSELIERNNFGSFRLGGLVRKGFAGFMIEGAVNYVFVLETETSRMLGLTPYRQPTRPSRVEIDINLSYALFEGVVTPIVDFIPPSEMVLMGTVGVRYLVHPQVIVGDRDWSSGETWTTTQTWQDIGASLATVQLLDEDRERLERRALAGMAIDPALVHTMAGFTFDTYYQPGLFFSARSLLGIPALAVASGTRLGFWWEISFATGWAF
jgi:hypothetical protein